MNWYKIAINEEELGYLREFNDIVVNVENTAGTERCGIDSSGKEWRTKMHYDYGFVSKISGADGEGIDVYLGPNEESDSVFVVHQNDPDTGEYDEDKVMLGFENDKDAKKSYLMHYDSNDFFGTMEKISFDDFKNCVNGKDCSKVIKKFKNK